MDLLRVVFFAGLSALLLAGAPPARAAVSYRFTPIAESGERFVSFTPPTINAAGTLAFGAGTRAGGGGAYRGDGSSVVAVAEEGTAFRQLAHEAVILPDGSLAFFATAASGRNGIHLVREPGGPATIIAEVGAGFRMITPTVRADGAGRVWFGGAKASGGGDVFSWRDGRLTSLSEVTREAKAGYSLLAVGPTGRLVYGSYPEGVATLSLAGGDGPPRTVARAGPQFARFGAAAVNGTGAVAFVATLKDDQQALYLAPADGKPPLPLGNPAGLFQDIGPLFLTDAGKVVFRGQLKSGFSGIFDGPDPERDRVLVTGDELLGSTARAVELGGVNAAGQVGLLATLADGRRVIVRADPAGARAGATVAARPEPAAPATTSAPGPARPAAPGQPRVVVLRKADETRGGSVDRFQGRLARELFRQAMLLLLREDLGLAVRDEQLGEAAPADAEVWTLELGFYPQQDGTISVSYNLARPAGNRQVAIDRVAVPDPLKPDYAGLAGRAEELARTKWRAGLEAAGLTGVRPAPARAEAPAYAPPAATLAALAEMSPLAQFAALRALHDAPAAAAAAPGRLGALVRGYAQLGLLTDFFWIPLHPAFHARALVYAQRWAARAPDDPAPLHHRAFALALAGAHAAAEADLAAAAKRPAQSAPPAWVPLIEAAIRFDDEALGRAPADPTLAPLAALLRLRAIQDGQAVRAVEERGAAILKASPECFGVYDALYRARAGLNVLHQTTELAPRVLDAAIPKRLAALPGLPPGVAAALRGGGPELDRALRDAGPADPSPLSWAILGRMLRELRFTQAWNRADFMAHRWAVPVAEFLDEARPRVADHPYLPYLESLALEGQPAYAARLRSIQLDPSALDLYALPMLLAMQQVGASGNTARALAFADAVYRDLAFIGMAVQATRRGELARRLRDVSPHAPLAVARMIEFDWPYAEGHAADWEEEFARQPPVLGALGRRYAELRRWEDAERCLRAYLRLSPDGWAYTLLAATYRTRGDIDRWKATLDEYLQQEDSGLGHAQARAQIAYYYMDQGDYRTAEPYAAAAAETQAAWAMICASACYEGLGDWARSEQWIRLTSERYEPNAPDWYSWCRRTGRGDEAAARRLAEAFVKAVGVPVPRQWVRTVAGVHQLGGRLDLAKQTFYPGRYASSAPMDKLLFALLLSPGDQDEAGQRGRIAAELVRTQPALAPLAELLRPGADVADRLAAVNRVREGLPADAKAEWAYVLGRLLLERGRGDEALALLDEAAGETQADPLLRAQAAVAARDFRAARERRS